MSIDIMLALPMTWNDFKLAVDQILTEQEASEVPIGFINISPPLEVQADNVDITIESLPNGIQITS